MFTGKHDLVLCGFGKGWDKTKKFIKKHKKAILIGAVVATVIITASAMIIMSGGAASPGAQALVSGGAGIVGAIQGNDDANQIVQPLDPILEQKIEEFKEQVYQNNLLITDDPTFPEEESTKAIGLAFSRSLLQEHLEGLSNAENIYQNIENKFSSNPWLKSSQSEECLPNFYHIRGEKALELGYYNQAVSDLNETIKLQPQNDTPYLDRASAFYQIGDYNQSINDYGHYLSKNPSFGMQDFSKCTSACARGVRDGATKSGRDQMKFAANTVLHPIRTITEIYQGFETLVSLYKQGEFSAIGQGFSPEGYKLFNEWDNLDMQERCYLASYIVGENGFNVLAPIAAAKATQKVLDTGRKLLYAEKILTLERGYESFQATAVQLGITSEAVFSEKVVELSSKNHAINNEVLKRLAVREEVLKNAKLVILSDSQGKHILGHRNYEPSRNRSIFTHSDPETFLKKYAGTGTSVTPKCQPGSHNYKEIINFEEIIGYDVRPRTGEKIPTTWGKIHYGKKGAHIVPYSPKGGN